jgi:excisionase family DNA binding protein
VLYTVEEARGVLRVGRSTLYRLIDRGELKTLHIGRRIFISEAALHELAGGAEQRETTRRQAG